NPEHRAAPLSRLDKGHRGTPHIYAEFAARGSRWAVSSQVDIGVTRSHAFPLNTSCASSDSNLPELIVVHLDIGYNSEKFRELLDVRE
ncbi:hypothetical protein, partial [Leucobacter ruminantium]